MKASDLLTDIRAELADPTKERWSDSRLLVLLSQAQVEVASETRVLIKRISIPVIAGQREYNLDKDTELVLRVTNTQTPIELLSHYEMDALKTNWEQDTGPTVEKVVYDLLSPNKLILYPIPLQASDADVYTIEAGASNTFVGGELLGVVTSIDNYSMTSVFGVVADLVQPGIEEVFNSVLGVVTSISESSGTLQVQYAKRPAALASEDSELELSAAFYKALLHLTCFNALNADIDAKSSALADRHYSLYGGQLARLKNNKAHNQVKGNNARTIVRNPYAG